jgi:ATP-dependent 26S proteasome regulatory subunit
MSPAKKQVAEQSEAPAAVADLQDAGTIGHLDSMVKANIPYIWAITFEETRFINDLVQYVAGPLNRELFVWSAYQGMVEHQRFLDEKKAIPMAEGHWDKSQHPGRALEKILAYEVPKDKNGAIFVLQDFHTCLVQPLPRQMRDAYKAMVNRKLTVVITSPVLAHGQSGRQGGMEPTLEKELNVVSYELPTRAYIDKQIRSVIAHLKQQKKKGIQNIVTSYSEKDIEKCVTALSGLTALEVNKALFTSICRLKALDERSLLDQKKQIVQRSEILEFISATPKMDEVGGLDAAKEYFDTYTNQFSKEAEAFGVEPLRGVLLTGVPGTGKSLLAKAIAALWNLPLLRLDVGKVMTGLVGGSEEKMRQVINQVEAIAPCILWIDEIEKSLSGTKSSNFSDGGTLARVFGTLLTAMEERMKGVVCIATANDIDALPPELIRRFNEVMFVDLPTAEERQEIFEIHLKKRKRDPHTLGLNYDQLVSASSRYTGSEIEKAVREGIARAFRKKKKEVDQEDLLGAIKDTKCIATVMREQIDYIRKWAKNKARYASSLAAAANAPGQQKVTTNSGKELDINGTLDNLEEITSDKKQPPSEVKPDMSGLETILDD